MNKLPEKEWFRPDEFSKYFGVPLSTIYAWINSGRLPALRLPGKTIRISRITIEKIEKTQFE